jgi:hypothetical protein
MLYVYDSSFGINIVAAIFILGLNAVLILYL